MAITRDPNYPVEYAQLANAFNHCADGHSIDVVLNAALQMVAASIGVICKSRGCSRQDVEGYTDHICDVIGKEVRSNWDRKQKPEDITVGTS